MIGRLADAVTGPRGRLVTIAVWVLIGVAGFLAHSQINDVTAAGQSSFLPSKAESTLAIDALERSSGGGEEVPVVIIFEREGRLTQADLNAIGRIGKGLDELRLTGATPIVDPFSAEALEPLGDVARIAHGVGPISRDGEAALVVLAIDAEDRGAIAGGVGKIRRYLAEHRPAGVKAYVTGPGGIAADLDRVANEAGETLLVATLALVLLLLLIVYRAPLLALLPLLTVGAAYLVAIGIAYLLIEAGWIVVNIEGTFLLLVLIFGAGTDYSLLLVHRYREELDAGKPPAVALPTALRQTAPALAASAGTVIAAMLVLLVADLQSTHWLGPILAIGIAVMLAAAFTLLPALLSLLDGRAFWRPGGSRRAAAPPEAADREEPRNRWLRVAELVRRRSRPIIVVVFAALIVLSLGNLGDHETIGFGQGETKPTNSSRGTEALEAHFPAGLGAPLTAVVRTAQLEKVTEALEELHTVQLALPVPPTGEIDKAVVVVVTHGDPYSSDASDMVEGIRERLHEVDPGALLGGVPAENFDIEQTNERDTKLIVPLVLLVVGLILAAVLRALVAPLYLMVTVVASFAATLGLVTFGFAQLGGEGIAFNLVLMSFIFLVALGVDYNIFLMTRAREDAVVHGTREGTLRALVSTGGVVTGAGLILAGTFATLTLLPLEELIQIGATVAIGVLLDTFVVRALLIPAITYRLGDRAWLPSRPGGK
ncbi:MAG TPA: MMPL family transporter [Solirubrobacterales bacterium]|nr:MMPL family transporter [Solirubrobacterales bacterium]